ncbi:hypothetical protein BAZOLSSOX_2263 [uncultured Gammaproteobacteria bacterium]|nr:hypothetical protein BAZOLSSOX_2263 [uncultured Gammaproteobacteria bacterium]
MCSIHHHTGGLEMIKSCLRNLSLIHHHTGGLENNDYEI